MLADRVVLLSRRPGKISRILNIGIPRAERELPQHTEEIAEYIRIIWEHNQQRRARGLNGGGRQ